MNELEARERRETQLTNGPGEMQRTNCPGETQLTNGPGEVMYSLIHAAHALEARLEAAYGTVGLSGAKHSVLSALSRAETPLALSELAEHLRCVRSNMTQLIDRLEADGLVRRVDDPTDRRVVRAALTPLGREREEAGAKEAEQVYAEFAASLPEADRLVLSRLLGRVVGMSTQTAKGPE